MNLNTGWHLDVSCGHRTCGVLGEVCNNWSVVLRGDNQVLDVQDYLNNVFLDTWDSRELVRNTLDTDVGNCSTWDGAKKGAAEGVS